MAVTEHTTEVIAKGRKVLKYWASRVILLITQCVKKKEKKMVMVRVTLHETDDYVGAEKNDIIQASCQH